MIEPLNSDGFFIYIDSSGNIRIRCADVPSSFSSGTSVRDGLWHHVVLTWNTDGGKIKLYVDKILEATKPNVGSPTEMTGEPTTADIGQNTSGSSYFKGNINDVAIYGSELSEAQVGVVYNNGNPKDETYETGASERYLKVYFKFEEGSGTTATNIMETGVGRLTNGTAYEEH